MNTKNRLILSLFIWDPPAYSWEYLRCGSSDCDASGVILQKKEDQVADLINYARIS